MLRVLISGATPSQMGSDRRPMKIYTPVFALRDALQEMGHEVFLGEIDPDGRDRDVDRWDLVVLGLAPPNSVSSKAWHLTAWMMKQRWDAGAPMATIIDDWHVSTIPSGLRRAYGFQSTLVKYWDRFGVRNNEFLHRPSTLEAMHEVEYRLLTQEWPLCILPSFPWGDNALPLKDTNATFWTPVDFTSMIPKYEPGKGSRKAAWCLTGLSRYDDWIEEQKFTWPLEMYGNRRQGQPTFKEPEAVGVYSKYLGAVAGAYYHAGSGYWRTRYAYVSMAETVHYCDPKDQAILGEPYQHSVYELEHLGPSALRDIALAQKEWFWTNCRSKGAMMDEIRAALVHAQAGVNRYGWAGDDLRNGVEERAERVAAKKRGLTLEGWRAAKERAEDEPIAV